MRKRCQLINVDVDVDVERDSVNVQDTAYLKDNIVS